jgi:hypothetical protein
MDEDRGAGHRRSGGDCESMEEEERNILPSWKEEAGTREKGSRSYFIKQGKHAIQCNIVTEKERSYYCTDSSKCTCQDIAQSGERGNQTFRTLKSPQTANPSSAIAMANMPVSEMRLPPHLAYLLAARRLTTAKVSSELQFPSNPHLLSPIASGSRFHPGRAVAAGGRAHGRPRRRPPHRARRHRPRQRGRLPSLPHGTLPPAERPTTLGDSV